MKLDTKQLSLLERRKNIVLATANERCEPTAVFVEFNGITNGLMVVTDNEMQRTRQNIIANEKVAILVFEADHSYCLKLFGKAKYHSDGIYFEFVKNLPANTGRVPKGAITIEIEKVVEFF